jgi:hypothetical protein
MYDINSNSIFSNSKLDFTINEKLPLFNDEDSEYEYLKNNDKKKEKTNISFEGIISKEPLSNQYEIVP